MIKDEIKNKEELVMEQYIIYILRDEEYFFVGKVKLEQAIRELNLHRSGKYQDTKKWFRANKDDIEIFWLEIVGGGLRRKYLVRKLSGLDTL